MCGKRHRSLTYVVIGMDKAVITEKPQADRIKETMEILKSINILGIPLNSPEVNELKGHFNNYVKDGTCWAGSISFERFGRIVDVNLPKRADKLVEVTLRLPRVKR